MSELELFELTWYIRDHLFRRYNQEGIELIADNIPVELTNVYLRYRDSDIEHLRELAKVVLRRLQEVSVLVPSKSSKLSISAMLNRYQCSKCKYISYLTKLETMRCFRCGSDIIEEFTGKRTSPHNS
ncbi:MAG: hypothetical protein ACE5KA_05550 [Nitrososphaerales archaeon]